MKLEKLPYRLSVCRTDRISDIDHDDAFYFIGRTDEEISLVCRTEHVPAGVKDREDGWRCFRIQGVLDFSLVGILADLSRILAENMIGIFAVSTFNTDYILVKEENFDRAMEVLADAGYEILNREVSS
ncbi:MAG: ACT domain-containing protein [Solobacterium sp.]|nr:ACT domain-containing protein [Solobacterium sp.]